MFAALTNLLLARRQLLKAMGEYRGGFTARSDSVAKTSPNLGGMHQMSCQDSDLEEDQGSNAAMPLSVDSNPNVSSPEISMLLSLGRHIELLRALGLVKYHFTCISLDNVSGGWIPLSSISFTKNGA
jgi:hypothetical protein